MKNASGQHGILFLAALPFALAGCNTTPSGGPECKEMVSAEGEAKLQSVAQGKARSNWRDTVGSMYGQPYKNWNKAKNSSINCSHDGNIAALRRWTCVARAEPCNK